MKYLDLSCPKCGQKAEECVNTVMTHQPFEVGEDGEIKFELCNPIWDTSTGVTDVQGRELVRCGNGHEWFSRLEGVDHDRPKTVWVGVEECEVDALNALLDKAIEMLELEGTRDDEAQSAKINSVDQLQHKLTQALKSADITPEVGGAHALG